MLIRLDSLQNPYDFQRNISKNASVAVKKTKSLKIDKIGAHLDPTIFTINIGLSWG